MITHPDADAFMRVYLRDPTDTTTRLVFADWLEETGEPSNVAWAHFIRLNAEAARYPFGSTEREELETEAGGYAWRIRANLTVPAAHFVGYPRSLLQLLPAPNITVELEAFEIPRAVLELVPESVARENLVLPLDVQSPYLLVAAYRPHNYDLVQKLQFILNRQIIAVRAEDDDLHLAIDTHYGQTEVEYVDSLLVGFVDTTVPWFDPAELPVAQPDDAPVERLVNLLFLEAIDNGANRVHILPTPTSGRVEYRVGSMWATRNELPRRLLSPVANRIAMMSGIALEVGREGRAGGEFRFNYHGAVYTVRTAIEITELGPVIDLDISDHFELA